MIETCTFACRISPDTSTYVTVTPSILGSRKSVRMAILTTSRIASAAFKTRRDDIGKPREYVSRLFLRLAYSSLHSTVKLAVDLFHLVDLKQVAFLNVVEPGELDAALIAFTHLLGIILFAAQRLKRIIADDRAVADNPGTATALDHATQHTATSYCSHAADLEHLLYKHATLFDLALFRLEHALQRELQVVRNLIDHVITSNLY